MAREARAGDDPWLAQAGPAFRLMLATSWLAPGAWAQRQGECIGRALAQGVDWVEYLRLVDRHRIPAMAFAALQRAPGAPPPAATLDRLRRGSQGARLDALLQARLLEEVLAGFRRMGIPVLPLKGILLSLRLYDDLGLRQSRDLDLMVPAEALADGEQVLKDLGWARIDPAEPLTPNQWRALLRYEHHLGFQHPAGRCRLELHWRCGDEGPGATGRRWGRSLPGVWQGEPYRALAGADLAVHLCAHGADHAWARAKWLGDLARLAVLADPVLDWAEARAEAEAQGCLRALLQAQALLERLHGLPASLQDAGRRCRTHPASHSESHPVAELVKHALQALGEPGEFWQRGIGATLRARLAGARYRRRLWPRRPLVAELGLLLYARADYRTLPLPDSLFWVYVPLRPFLFLWRRLRSRSGRH
jgi:hypothetical protein